MIKYNIKNSIGGNYMFPEGMGATDNIFGCYCDFKNKKLDVFIDLLNKLKIKNKSKIHSNNIDIWISYSNIQKIYYSSVIESLIKFIYKFNRRIKIINNDNI